MALADPVRLTRRVFFTRTAHISTSFTLNPGESRFITFDRVYAPALIVVNKSRYNGLYGRATLSCDNTPFVPILPPVMPTRYASKIAMILLAGCIDSVYAEARDRSVSFELDIDVYALSDVVSIYEAGVGNVVFNRVWTLVDEATLTAECRVYRLPSYTVAASYTLPLDRGYPLAIQVCNLTDEYIVAALETISRKCGAISPWTPTILPRSCVVYYTLLQSLPSMVNAVQYARMFLNIGVKEAEPSDELAKVRVYALEITT